MCPSRCQPVRSRAGLRQGALQSLGVELLLAFRHLEPLVDLTHEKRGERRRRILRLRPHAGCKHCGRKQRGNGSHEDGSGVRGTRNSLRLSASSLQVSLRRGASSARPVRAAPAPALRAARVRRRCLWRTRCDPAHCRGAAYRSVAFGPGKSVSGLLGERRYTMRRRSPTLTLRV